MNCRSCGNAELVEILSLGTTPLANSLVDAINLQVDEASYPLDLVYCRSCTLVQITESIPPEALFTSYVYFSSFSDTMLTHAEKLADDIIGSRQLTESSLVIEIASNDGYLLKNYVKRGIPVLGIDPAENVVDTAARNGVRTLCNFFTLDLAQRLVASGSQADVVHAHNVLAHVPDLNGFIAGIRALLKPSGVAIIEVTYVRDLLERLEFDTIYHEHLSYFSLTALFELCSRQQLYIVDVQRIAIHGGSLRISLSLEPNSSPAVQQVLQQEAEWGVRDLHPYMGFAERVAQLGHTLRKLLYGLKSGGARIAAYGASAKGSTLLNHYKIGTEILDYVVDRSMTKVGLYTPGTHLHIFDPTKLLRDLPDYTLLLTWNFADEILNQQAEYRARGGTFIVPIPNIVLI